MKHAGACSKTCGHSLDYGHVKANPETQHALNTDPRVVEWTEIEDGRVFEFVYAPKRLVSAIYRATARDLGIKDLS